MFIWGIISYPMDGEPIPYWKTWNMAFPCILLSHRYISNWLWCTHTKHGIHIRGFMSNANWKDNLALDLFPAYLKELIFCSKFDIKHLFRNILYICHKLVHVLNGMNKCLEKALIFTHLLIFLLHNYLTRAAQSSISLNSGVATF